MKLIVIVKTSLEMHRFAARLHSHSSSRTFFLDPKKFYRRWGKKVPRKHHELEILEPAIEVLRQQPLHVHQSDKSPNLFVCYPLAVRTAEAAAELFRMWCAGVVLTWKYQIDLNTVYDRDCKGDKKKFFRVLKHHYKITAGHVVTK